MANQASGRAWQWGRSRPPQTPAPMGTQLWPQSHDTYPSPRLSSRARRALYSSGALSAIREDRVSGGIHIFQMQKQSLVPMLLSRWLAVS